LSKCAICRAEYERKYMSQSTCGEPICKAELRRQTERKKAWKLRKIFDELDALAITLERLEA